MRAAAWPLLACLVAGAPPPSPAAGAPGPGGVTPLGAIDVPGRVMSMQMDVAGGRILVATVRYPGDGTRRDELHLHELSAAGPPVHRLTREIDDAVAVALSPDGGAIAVGCGAHVCLHDWEPGPARARLAAPGRPRELGALALRPDVGLLLAAQRSRMEMMAWALDSAARRAWAVATPAERLREGLTPRLHGRPSWTPRWVGVSPDGRRVAATRDDGTVSLWGRDGTLIKALALPYHAELDPAFAPDGALLALRAGDGRLAAVDVETERVVLSVADSLSLRALRRAALLPGGGARYLAVSRPEGVALHAIPSGDAAAVVPGPDEVWGIAMSGDAGVVAVAGRDRVTLWRVR